MKRTWLVMLLCMALCLAMVFSFAACGKDEDNGGNNDNKGNNDNNPTIEKVTVTFMNGETVVDTIEINKGTAVAATTKTVTAPEGKQFKSWQKDGVDYDFTAKVNENITLVATFEDIPAPAPTTFTITFKDADGNVLTSFQVEKKGYINPDDVPTAPDKTADHLTFVRWGLEGETTIGIDYDMEIIEDVTYVAIYEASKYTVTIKDADTNEVLDTQTIPYGGKVTPYQAPVGKEIVSVKLGDADFDYDTYTVEGNIEILVKLTAAVRTVKITGEGMDFTFTVPKGGTLTDEDYTTLFTSLATAPAEGYLWSLDLSKLVNVEENVTVTVTKVAKTDYRTAQGWLGLTTKTTDAEKEKYGIGLNHEGDATKNPAFRNWGTIFWQQGQYIDVTMDVAGTFQIAYNTDKPGQHFTIHVYIDGVLFKVETIDSKKGGNIEVTNVPAGEHNIRVMIASATFDAEGGEPLGEWAGFTISGFRYYEHKSLTPTITFKNGDEVFTTVTGRRGETVTAPTELPTLQYFLFDKWLLNNAEFDFSTPIDDDITLTASFKRDPAYVKISFVSDGKTFADDVYVAVNGTVTAPEGTPTKDGYLFQFWAKKGESTAYDFTAAIAEDLTLEANFKLDANEYTLTFMNGTEKVGEIKVIEGKNGTLPATPDGSTYWTATAEEYAKIFNVTENRTVAISAVTVAKEEYVSFKQWTNSAAGIQGFKDKEQITSCEYNWDRNPGCSITFTGNIVRFGFIWMVPSEATYEILVDGVLVKTVEITKDMTAGGTVTDRTTFDGYSLLGPDVLTAAEHTITIRLASGVGDVYGIACGCVTKTTSAE